MTPRASLFAARWSRSDRATFPGQRVVLTADCPTHWPGDRLTEGADAALAFFAGAARAISGFPATQVVTSDPVLAHGLAGLARCLAVEAPQCRVQVLLLDPHGAGPHTAPDEILIDARGGAPLARRFEPTAAPEGWTPHGHVVVTGGNGAIAHLLCRTLVPGGREGLRGATLIGRSDPSAQTRDLLADLRAAGLAADWLRDGGTAPALVQALDRCRAAAGPVTAILHGAGMTADGLLGGASLPPAGPILRAKLGLARDLDLATQDDPLEVFAGFSSLASVLGNEGQGLYAFANGLLDGFLIERQAQGQRGLRRGRSMTFNWGYWAEGGMRLGTDTLAALQARDGVEPISTRQALQALWAGFGTTGQLAVAAGEPGKILDRLNRGAGAGPVAAAQGSDALARAVAARLRVVLAEAGRRQPDEIDPLEPFAAYGVDSLMIVDVMQRLRPVFGDLPRALMFEHGSVERMARWLAGAHPVAAADWTGVQAAPAVRPAAAAPVVRSEAAEVVIVGMAGQFPDAPDIDRLWQNLLAGHDAIREVPVDRWDMDALFDPDPARAHEGFSYARWGGFLPGFADFDPAFFGMTPREALETDPQERLFLSTAWHAIEDAGLTSATLRARLAGAVGVFAGVTKSDHSRLGLRRHGDGSTVHARASFSSVANRVSFVMDLHGPSLPVDTMCSSSLTALHQAREALLRGDCALALAGGVNLYQHPSSYAELCQSAMLASDGRCRSFGAGGTGFVPGEGVACLVLTTRQVAQDLGLRVEAVLRATAVNHGGAANGYTVPNPAAQRALVRGVLDAAGCTARDIGYVEAHGTGTALGDPIEVESLTAAFAPDGAEVCDLGSIKSNIGHLEAAAGISGLIKVLLQIRHGVIVPTLHSATPNSAIDFSRTPFRLVQQGKPWAGPRRAIVNSFGAGGANACALVEAEAAEAPPSTPLAENVLLLSARSRGALIRQAEALRDWLARQPPAAAEGPRRLIADRLGVDPGELPPEAALADLGLSADDLRWLALETGTADLTLDTRLSALAGAARPAVDPDALCYTLQAGRMAMPVRVALRVAGADSIAAALATLLADPEAAGIVEVARADRSDLAALQAHPTVAQTMADLLVRRDLARLAGLWLRGLEPDWARLYPVPPKPLSLAGYPFETRRLWLGDLPEAHPVAEPAVAGAFRHRPVARMPVAPEPVVNLEGPAGEAESGPAEGGAVKPPRPADLAELVHQLRLILSRTMDLGPDEIDATVSFADYGLDSILGIRFVDALNRALDTRIKTTAIFEHPTIIRLAEHLRAAGVVLSAAEPATAPATALTRAAAGPVTEGTVLPAGAATVPVKAIETALAAQAAPSLAGHPVTSPVAAAAPFLARDRDSAPIPDSAIAIIGQSGRYPGAPDLEAFWQNLLAGHGAVGPVTRWPLPETVRCRTGGFLDAIDRFDATFFNISGAEARTMDPQQRLFLEESWRALEQAGHLGEALSGLRCGVHVGCYTGDYQDLFPGAPSAQSLWGNMGSVIPARIAYHLDLQGPTMAYDTACSSSLVAVDAACKALARGEIDLALAGGVFLQATPRLYLAADKAGMLSPTGQSYSFDARADGFVPGEGVGVVVLKRLADAERAGDTILAVIEGSAVNSNGKTNGIIAPSTRAQAALIAACHAAAGITAGQVTLVEAHGTGTALGDPIEFEALKEVFGTTAPVALTSVKPAIGHAQFAAGIASLQKAVLSLKNGMIPANQCFDQPNPLLDLGGSGFTVPAANRPWTAAFPRRAGVSSFGASGTNAHVVLREAPPQAPGACHAPAYPVLLSARSAAGLRAMAADLADWCEAHPEAVPGDVAFTLMTGRMLFEQRQGFEAVSLADLAAQIRGWLAGIAPRPPLHHRAVLEAFSTGQAPRWASLFPADRPRRIPLPGTVFERSSYWIEAAPPQAPAFRLTRLDAVTFALDLPADSPLLRDHQVKGSPVLPGLALPEIMRQVLSAVEGRDLPTLTIRDLSWLRAIDLSVRADLRLVVGPEDTGAGRRITVEAGGAVLAQARVATVPIAAPALPPVPGGEAVAVEAIRSRLVAGGIVHGPFLRGLESLRRAGRQAAAVLADPSSDPLPLSPVLLDSAVQAAVVFREGAADSIPFSVDEITLLHPATARMEARLDAPRQLAAGTLGGLDVDLCLPDGTPAIRLRGVTARPIPGARAAAVPQGEGATHALVPVWMQAACDPAPGVAAPEVVFHLAGTRVPDALWPGVPRAPLAAPADWAQADRFALWIAGEPADPAPAEKALVRQVLDLVQAVLATGGEARPVSFTVLTLRALHMAGFPASGFGASLPGLFGSLGREYPSWAVRLADLDAVEGVAPEALPDRRVLVLRDGLWLEQVLGRLADLPRAEAPYRAGSVYVVIGGAGGVGRIWTEHVLRSAAAQVIWLGRSQPDATIAAHQDELGRLGPRPVYLQADARDRAALAAARAAILARFGRIDGVVHSAITLADGSLAGMDWPRMEAVLSAKLDTLDAMVAVFAADMREFGVVFSSLQSFARMPGQSNYAAACTFGDSFVLEQAARRGLPLKVVNWGYWAEAGIVATDEHRRRMRRFGQLGLSRGCALAALDALLGGGPAQMAIAELDAGARVTMEREMPGLTLATQVAPPLPAGLSLPDASARWRPIHRRLGSQMDRFDPEMTEVLAASVAAAGLLDPRARAEAKGLPGIFARWWDETARVLAEAGYLTPDGYPDRPCPTLDQALAVWNRVPAAVADEPDLRDHVRLAEAMLRGLPDILAGRAPATDFMFPDGRFDLVNGVYHGNSVADFFNDILADAVESAVRARIAQDPGARLRLVEVGAGTGGTARVLFRRLAPYAANISEYLFTDLSKAFLIAARQNFLRDAPYLQTRIFDVSRPPQDQGLDLGAYDIAIATNVLHATRDICQSLSHAKALLRQNGLILVNELIRKSLFSHLTFGLLDGWWAYDDAAMRLAGTPALGSDRWRAVLALTGFRSVAPLCPEAEVLSQQVFIGQSDGAVSGARPAAVSVAAPPVAAPASPPTAPAPIDLRTLLRARLSAAIEVDADRIEDDAPFERYGVDSILMLQFVDALRPEFPRITSTVLFEKNTVALLADHLSRTQPEAIERLASAPRAATEAEIRSAAGASLGHQPAAVDPLSLAQHSAAESEVGISVPSQPVTVQQRPGTTEAQPTRVAAGMSLRSTRLPGRDIAVIGMAGRFAQCADLDALWAAVAAGQALFRPAPQDGRSWPAAGPLPAGYMDGADRFDPLFFAISPAEALQMDPQERIFLQTAYHAIENSGYAPTGLAAQGRVGVFAGVMNAHYPTRAAFWSVANRLSFLFDFKGPSLACDTACSSSVSALYLAMEALRAGRCDVALAGGVNVIAHPRHLGNLAALGIQSRQGRLRPFSAEADGMLSGEGAGVVVLKTLDRALADGDRIEGILRGAALNSGGRSSSYTAPSPAAHAEVVVQALEDAGVTPDEIGVIEAHGTGTRLGDPIEIEGLRRALGPVPCAVSSVKANIGHAESAAGMAGLFKLLAQMRHGLIAPLPDPGRINPEIDLEGASLYFPREVAPWRPVAGRARIAGLSSFGAGGANAHVIVQEAPAEPARLPQPGARIVPLSARSAEQLRSIARNLLQRLETAPDLSLADVAFTLQTGRDALPVRWACVAQDLPDLVRALRALAEGRDVPVSDPMAQAWLGGARVDWAALWTAPLPRRVALPGYPFAEDSFWLEEPEASAAKIVPAAEVPNRGGALALLCEVVGQTLGLAADRLDLDTPLDSYGLDSVMITRATDRLEDVLGPLSKTLFYEYRSLRSLAAHLEGIAPLPAAAVAEAAPEPIAIIGLAGRYPQAETLDSFWQALCRGQDCVTAIPADRWDHDRFYAEAKAPGRTRSKWGGFLNGVDLFDAAFFGILPKDAELSDPQERLFVETAWHALEDAGHSPESLSAAGRVGVFVGVMYSEYQLLGAERTAEGVPTALSSSPASIANRVSYLFDFQGPSLAVDTMCASSLTAIHLAVRALRAGECRAAVAGGVNLTLHPNKYLMMAHGGFEATDGRCRSFGEGGTGYVPSEGVGAVVLKPLSQAQADGDPIWAVIRGSAVNHGGRSNGYTVPDPVAQAATIQEALADGGVAPRQVSYVECHGTGTALGDPIEVSGLKRVFGPDHPLALGSVKSNIGHCESAAGIAGLTKVLLQMKHRMRVPSLHSDRLNPNLGLDGTAFRVDQAVAPWTDARLLAGVSSFGAGGSNAHLVLEEAPPAPTPAQSALPCALVLSARTPAQLAQMARALADVLERDRPDLASVAYTLQTGRRAQPQRAGLLASTHAEAVAGLRAVAEGAAPAFEGDSPAALLLRRWLAGERVDWSSLHPRTPPRVRLPLYPFAGKSYWGVPRGPAAVAAALQQSAPAAPASPDRLALFRPVWSPAAPRPRDSLPERLVVDLTGRLPEREGECLSIPVGMAEDVAAALVARLGPLMARARVPGLLQFVLPGEAGPLLPALTAFAGTMAQERRHLDTQVIELAAPVRSDELDVLLAREAATTDRAISLRPQGRFVRHLARLDLPRDPAAVPDGTVIISGGLGGLGRIIAADIARRSPDTPIVLLGRRARDAATEAQLSGIGARRPGYHSLDITDPHAVEATLAQIRAEVGPIGMVVHSAGILRDGMLMAKSPQDAHAVVATKAAGARALDLATRNDPLRAFVLCGSLAGVSGNAGQADYAFGNGWLDGFAATRRGPGRTLSLDWPLWAEGGMTVPDTARAAMREGFGLAPMPASAGLDAMWRALASAEPQVLVAWGDPERIEATLDGGSARRMPTPSAPVAARPAAVLVELVAEVLRVPEAEVQVDCELADYGFDSIALADLADRCAERLGLPVSPSLFYSFGTLRQVGDHLAAELAQAVPAVTPDPDPEPARPRARPADPDEAVAVVGMSGAFPGAPDLDRFWQNLIEGRPTITEIPPDRWNWRELMGDPKAEPGRTNIRWGGFLDDIAAFDPLFFGISPREAESMDPHQRLLLTHAWRAIEDAGIAPASLSGSNTAVFLGTAASEYAAMAREAGLVLQQQSPSGVVGSLAPNRISHLLNLNGPSEPVETACSSALVALHRAVEAIRSGCDGALVGAVNTILMPHGHVSFARSGMLSPDGQCRTFAADANGYVRSEGVAVLMLRRLSDARREGLPIHGVIRATGVNHGGRGISLFAPNAPAQARLVADVLAASGIDPATITAVEAHGTGTAVGDPIEIEGLKRGFQTAVEKRGGRLPEAGQIALASVKSWIGHCEAAAGIAGLIKVLLQMRHGVLIPDANRREVNPAIHLSGTPFRLVDRQEPWTPLTDPDGQALLRRAGLSSFGFGGVNAHAVIEEAAPAATPRPVVGPEVIVLSAQSASALRATAASLGRWLEAHPEAALDRVAVTLQLGRNALRHRLAFVAQSVDEAARTLSDFAAGSAPADRVFAGTARAAAEKAGDLRDPSGLARAWVAGAAVVWPARPDLVRLGLPPTAMDLRRCWFSGAAAPASLMRRDDDAEGAFTALFDASAPFVRDHLVQGEPVLPGTAYVEMVRGAAAEVFGTRHLSIRDLGFERMARGAMLSPPLRLHLEQGPDGATFHIRGAAGIHARGRVAPLDAPQPRRLDLDALRERATLRLEQDAFYDAFGRMGLGYGPGLRLIETAQAGDGVVLSRLKQVWPQDSREARLALPPNLVDAALQTTLGFALMQGSGKVDLAVPVKIHAIDVFAPLGAEVVVVAEQEPGSRTSNITLCAPDGTTLVQIRGFVTAPVGRPPSGRKPTAQPDAGRQRAVEAALQARIRDVVAELTHIAADAIDTDADLVEFGLDSVSFHELASRLSQDLKRDIAPTAFFDSRTIAALATRLAPLEARTMPAAEPVALAAAREPVRRGDILPDAGNDAALAGQVVAMIAALLHIDASDLTPETGLAEIGLDSIAFAELAGQLSALLGAEVSPAALYDCATVGALVERCARPAQANPPLGAALLALIADLAHLAPEDVDLTAPLADFGFDSVIYAELAARISSGLGVSVDPHDFYGMPNIAALADRLGQGPAVAPRPAPVPAPAETAPGEPAPDGFAIIGMSGAFPGAPDPEALWQNMLEGRDVISRPPGWRWDWKKIDGDPRLAPGRTNIHWGGFLDGLADFDPAFFGLSTAEAEIMDPQQRLMMMHVWAALEAAGHAPRSLAGSKTGLYMGVASGSYAMMIARAGRSTDPRWVMGNVVSMGLNRISHMLDLQGPSEPFETACSSSLVALHRGVEDLRSGVCDMIVAGGVNSIPNEDLHVAFSAAGMLSPDGRCKTFDKDANGYVRSEGIGVVVVRRLADALRDGDEILGVIRGTGVRHAGRAVSLTAPNPQSQAALIREVMERAEVDPATVSFIEAHGTGTALGDPIEIEGLKAAFEGAPRPGFCTIGAVKTHVGHLEMAAGVTGLIKVLLQMRHRQIVGNLHCQTMNPLLRLEGSPFRLAQTTGPWAPVDAEGRPLPLRAGISSFGFGGVNAHVVVEGPPMVRRDDPVDQAPQAILLSAASDTALRAQARRLHDWIAARPGALTEPGLLARIAVTLQDGRDALSHRLALVAGDVARLSEGLRAWLAGAALPAGVTLRTGQTKGKPAFLRADDLRMLVAQWAVERDLDRACDAWVEGSPIDWLAFRRLPARRIPLPTYPFDCTPFWVGTAVAPEAPPVAAPVDVGNGVEDTLRRIAAAYRGIGPADIDLDAPFSELGFDSIGIMTVVSRLTAALPEHKLGEMADRLLQATTLRAIAAMAEGEAPETRADKPEILHLDLYAQGQKKDAANVVIARPVLHLGKAAKASARLVIDETHPLFFDHPLDHVSGLHLAEAICQLARAAELCQHHRDPRAAVFLRQLRFDFPSMCAKQPAEVLVRPETALTHGYRGEVRQGGVVVAQGQLAFGPLDGEPTPVAETVASRRLRKGRVNKSNADNVLLAGLETDGKTLRASLSVSPRAGFYNDVVGPAQDGIVLLEAVRQVMRAISTEDGAGGGKDRVGLLRQMEIALDRPVWRGEAVEFVADTDGSLVVGGAALLSVQGEILAPGGGDRIGRFSTSATQITQELHRAWSQNMTARRD